MQAYQQKFIQLCLENHLLRFGEFKLKSGRISPYFFNSGLFNTGASLAALGQYYAKAIVHAKLEFDVLFGPAYKGIPLVSATAIALAEHHQKSYAYAFNRKEAKHHGEGGEIVGHELQGKILIVDDVISAGTTVRESMKIINNAGAKAVGIVIAMDRQEKGQADMSAVAEVEQLFNVSVTSVIKLQHILDYVSGNSKFEAYLPALKRYQERYGIQ